MKILKIVLFGVLIYVAINLLMLIASLLLSSYEGRDNTYLVSLNSFAIAVPVGILTFLLARLLKTATRKEAWLRSIIWTGLQVFFFFLIGLGNQTLPNIFGAIGFYVLMIFVFLGPMVFAWTKKLPAR
jgi:hypothetical protein